MERYKKVLFVKIHDIWFETEKYNKSSENVVALHTNQVLDKSLFDEVFVTKTMLIDISCDKDIIFKEFDYKSARYPINKATKDGIIVKRVENEEEEKQFFSFHASFCREKGIPILSQNELAELECYSAWTQEKEYLGGCAFFTSQEEGTVRYKYGSTKHKMNANEIILWKAMCDYHDRGFRWFDMGGVIPTEDKDSYYYRHFKFKEKFGGKLVDSYTYFKFKGIERFFYYIFKVFLKLFFANDINGFTNFLSRHHIIR